MKILCEMIHQFYIMLQVYKYNTLRAEKKVCNILQVAFNAATYLVSNLYAERLI